VCDNLATPTKTFSPISHRTRLKSARAKSLTSGKGEIPKINGTETAHTYNVLQGSMRERIREIIRQTCDELGVHIVRGVLARDHVHMYLSIPPKLSLSDVMQRIKGGSSRRIQMEFPDLRKRYWGRRFLFSGMLRIPCQAVGRAGTSRPRPEM